MQPANHIPVGLNRILGALAGGVVIVALAAPRFAQDPAYHQFADTRPLLGIPNSLNVLSNLPFAFVGCAGLVAVARMRAWERGPRDDRFFYLALGAYLLAKVFESADGAIYEAGRIVSGHTMKHVVAAAALWFIVAMLRRRRSRVVSESLQPLP